MQNFSSLADSSCITLIGMPGSGKTAVGLRLANMLGWAHIDTDHLIEAAYGVELQAVVDALDRETFLDVESQIIQTLRVERGVISTGGSVIYREKSMQDLLELGPIIYLEAPLNLILARIAEKPNRGISLAKGQTVKNLFEERKALYEKWATYRVQVEGKTIDQCAEKILIMLA